MRVEASVLRGQYSSVYDRVKGALFMRLILALCCPVVLLVGCDVHSNADTKGSDAVHIAVDAKDGGSSHVSVNVPGFDAKVSVPNFMTNGGHMDIDGMKLAPDTKIASVDVLGDGDKSKDGGSVHLAFTNPKPPADLIAYYRQAAGDAGYTVSTKDDGLDGAKGAKTFSLRLSAEGGGSRGAIDIKGED